MKTLALTLIAVLTPGLALAHGGHPEMQQGHDLFHLLWLAVPVIVTAGAVLFAKKSGIRREN